MLFPKIIRLNEVSQLEWYVDRDMLQKHAVDRDGGAWRGR